MSSVRRPLSHCGNYGRVHSLRFSAFPLHLDSLESPGVAGAEPTRSVFALMLPGGKGGPGDFPLGGPSETIPILRCRAAILGSRASAIPAPPRRHLESTLALSRRHLPRAQSSIILRQQEHATLESRAALHYITPLVDSCRHRSRCRLNDAWRTERPSGAPETAGGESLPGATEDRRGAKIANKPNRYQRKCQGSQSP